MFRLSILLLFFCISGASLAQVDSMRIIGPSVGAFEFKSSTLNADLKANGATGNFASSYTTIGIDNVRPVDLGGRYGEMRIQSAFGFGFILPQSVNADDTSGEKYFFHGWQIMTSLWGFALVEKRGFSISVAPGMEWGNLKIRLQNAPDKPQCTNSFIAPLARFEIRVSYGHLGAGMRATYRYDISNSNWINDVEMHPLPKFRNSGYGFQFYIGYVFRKN